MPLSLASRKINESTRKDLGMVAGVVCSCCRSRCGSGWSCSPPVGGQRCGAEGAALRLKYPPRTRFGPCDGYAGELSIGFCAFLSAFPLHASPLFHLLTK